jgi:hypothetical protein
MTGAVEHQFASPIRVCRFASFINDLQRHLLSFLYENDPSNVILTKFRRQFITIHQTARNKSLLLSLPQKLPLFVHPPQFSAISPSFSLLTNFYNSEKITFASILSFSDSRERFFCFNEALDLESSFVRSICSEPLTLPYLISYFLISSIVGILGYVNMSPSMSLKGFVATLLCSFVVMSFLASAVLAAPSAPLSCTTPSWMIFPQSNCRGTAQRTNVYDPNFCSGTCHTFDNRHYSSNYTCGGNRIASSYYYQSNCAGAGSYSTVATQECINYRSNSAALVCHPTDRVYPSHSHEGPVTGDGPLQPPTQCRQPYMCTPNVPFVTYFRDRQCHGGAFASYELARGAQINRCYYDSTQRLNVQYTCNHGTLNTRYFSSGCHNAEYALGGVPTDTCIYNSANGFGMMFFCGTTGPSFEAMRQAHLDSGVSSLASSFEEIDNLVGKQAPIPSPFDQFNYPMH